MFFVLSQAWDQGKKNEKILSPHEESNLRPSDSALRCSTAEPQRLHGERGLLRSRLNSRQKSPNWRPVLGSHASQYNVFVL